VTDVLEEESVKKVRAALEAAGMPTDVLVLDAAANTPAKAAKELDCEPGAVVQSLVYLVGKSFALALIAGDHRCVEGNLGPAFFIEGTVRPAEEGEIKFATGFPSGGVAPVALARKIPVVIDRSLKRFETVFVAAGHPKAVFPTTVDDLKRLTGGLVSYAVAEPRSGKAAVGPPPRTRVNKVANRK
jgi:prolyl-tRNA editing enzyme YbaK/EbsC (Cys-tRNA(Pro) deacylase)